MKLQEVVAIQSKTVEQSKVSIGSLMQPEHANPPGNIHGGEIMKLMDNAAAIVALRHTRGNVATKRVDQLVFHHPIHIGDFVICNAQLTFVGKSSMEVLVTVLVDVITNDQPTKVVALTAFFTLVALDINGSPAAAPPLEISNEHERVLFEAGRQRYLSYKAQRDRGY
jgi:acyl-CoA hydrolase